MHKQEAALEHRETFGQSSQARLNLLDLANLGNVRPRVSEPRMNRDARTMLDGFEIAEAPKLAVSASPSSDFTSYAPLFLSPNITPVHAESARDCMLAVPHHQLEQFRKAGFKIMAVRDVTEYDHIMGTNAASAHPEGYAPGASWKNVDVITDLDKKRIVLNEYYVDAKSGQLRPSYGVVERFRHEFAHALDSIRKNKLQDDPQLKHIYHGEAQKLTAAQRAQLSYYLQPGDAGLRETIATLYAIEHGGGADTPAVEKLLRTSFPKVFEYMRKQGF